jgi:hypothetical protein
VMIARLRTPSLAHQRVLAKSRTRPKLSAGRCDAVKRLLSL